MAKKLVIQKHHIIYESEVHKQKEEVVKIYKGEHWVVTQMNRRKNISKGFIKHIKVWLALNEDRAKELE